MGDKFQYGGQAVIEGVMMRGRHEIAVAVRRPDNEIVVDRSPVSSITEKFPFLKWPFFRGSVALVESMIIGMKALSFSANQAAEGEEEQLSSWEMFLTISVAVVLSILLFVVAPTTVARLLYFLKSIALINLLEGLFRIAIFLIYIVAISKMKDIQRVFQYHGAEHKTINAYEAGEELTVENVKKYSQQHPRCGTSFLLIVMVIMILVFGFLGKPSLPVRIISRILLLPVVAGISYEILKFSSRHMNSKIVRALIAPGLWLQKLTTREPDDSQIEVAIKALQTVLPNVESAESEKDTVVL